MLVQLDEVLASFGKAAGCEKGSEESRLSVVDQELAVDLEVSDGLDLVMAIITGCKFLGVFGNTKDEIMVIGDGDNLESVRVRECRYHGGF